MLPRQLATDRANIDRQTADALYSAAHKAPPDKVDELFMYAFRLDLCNELSNQWYTDELVNRSTGELFSGYGRFFTCNQKLCSYCLAHLSRRNKRRLREVIKATKIPVGYDPRFITLTLPNPDLPILETRERIYEAWTRFRKRDWFKKAILAYAKGEEFTLTKNGYHYHLHLLVLSRQVAAERLRTIWTDCNPKIKPETADGLLVANVKRINSMENAINEVSKYLTKTLDFAKTKHHSDLTDIALVRRWNRLFELGFSWRRPAESEADSKTFDDGTAIAYLDTRNLSDGNCDTWRKRLDHSSTNFLEFADAEETRTRDSALNRMEHLKYAHSHATFKRLKAPAESAFDRLRYQTQRWR